MQHDRRAVVASKCNCTFSYGNALFPAPSQSKPRPVPWEGVRPGGAGAFVRRGGSGSAEPMLPPGDRPGGQRRCPRLCCPHCPHCPRCPHAGGRSCGRGAGQFPGARRAAPWLVELLAGVRGTWPGTEHQQTQPGLVCAAAWVSHLSAFYCSLFASC